MAISTNQKPTIYRNLYENTGPGRDGHLGQSNAYDGRIVTCTRKRVHIIRCIRWQLVNDTYTKLPFRLLLVYHQTTLDFN